MRLPDLLDLSPAEKNGMENKHPDTRSTPQHDSDQVVVKPTKPAYKVIENIRYDTVWDIFAKEKTCACVRVVDNNLTTVSAITIDNTSQPNEDWEALYS